MYKRLILAVVTILSMVRGHAASVDAAILRYSGRVVDSSADPAARVPQLIVADTAAECPATDVGDGDLCYGKDTDTLLSRQNALWVTRTTGSVTLAGDVDGASGANDLDEVAVETELEGVLDLADLQGILTVAKGGTGAAPGAGDQALVSDSVSGATWRAIPDCEAENMLTYDTATNTFGCEADAGAGAGGDNLRVEDGDDAGTFTAATDADFSDQGDINFVLDTVPTPDTITGTVRADSVALTTDTTGNYAAGDAEAGAALTGDSATAFFSAGQIEAARGGTGDDTSATTGVPRIAAGNWTYDAGVSHLASSTSADLRGVLSDETGTGAAMFGLTTAMADDLGCTAGQIVKRNAADTAYECVTSTQTLPVCPSGTAGNGVCITYTDLPAAFTEAGTTSQTRKFYSLDQFREFRIIAFMNVAAVTGDISIQCDADSTFGSAATLGTLDNPALNGTVGSWTAMPANECTTAGGVWTRVGMVNGNGTEDPAAKNILLEVRY